MNGLVMAFNVGILLLVRKGNSCQARYSVWWAHLVPISLGVIERLYQ